MTETENCNIEEAENENVSEEQTEGVSEGKLEVEEQGIEQSVEIGELPDLLEALLYVSGTPLSLRRLCSVTKFNAVEVKQGLEELKVRMSENGSGLELIEIGNSIQLRTKDRFAKALQALKESRPKKLTPPALETLAIVAYRQPVVKSDVEAIRGVDAAPTLKTLLQRGLIRIVGHQATVGQPALYGTTDSFLELFGLKSLTELPSLRDLKELEEVAEDDIDSEAVEPLEAQVSEATESQEEAVPSVANM